MTPSAAMLAWIIANGKDSRFAGKGARPLMQRLSSSAAMAASAAGDELLQMRVMHPGVCRALAYSARKPWLANLQHPHFQ